jgi:hypothetical protein
MKNKMIAVVFVALSGIAVAARASQAEEGTGVGVMLGDPTGFSVKRWLDETRAVDAGLAWSTSDDDAFQLHADYLVNNFALLKSKDFPGRTALYYGIGGRIKFSDDTRIGARFPLGVDIYALRNPIDFFVEVAPIFDLIPSVRGDINFSVGFRVFLK